MAGDDVSPDEMQRFSSSRDPIDAVLIGDSLDKDLLDVAVLVHDVRSAYLSDKPLRRRPELVAYTGPTVATEMHLEASGPPGHAVASAPPASAACPDGLPSVAEPTRATDAGGKRTAASRFVAFVGTLGGKIAVGAVAMAAAAGGLHSAGAVDVPILPDRDQAPEQPSQPENGPDTTRDNGVGQSKPQSQERQTGKNAGQDHQRGQRNGQGNGQGKSSGAANRDAAQEYQDEVQDWNDCMAAAASSQSDPGTRGKGGVDPRAVCGPKPDPDDFGLGEEPDTAQHDETGSGTGDRGSNGDEAPPVSTPGRSGTDNPASQGSEPPGAGSGSGTKGGGASAQDTPGGTAPGKGKTDRGGPRSQAGQPSS